MPHDDTPRYLISAAAVLAGMHAQTLRQYDRLGLVSPTRMSGRGRRYSLSDIVTLRRVQQLSREEGINLAGIRRILDLEAQVADLTARVSSLATGRVFHAAASGETMVGIRGSRPARPERVRGGALILRQRRSPE